MSSQQKVLYLLEPNGKFAIHTAPVPEPGAGEVLVEIHSTSLNPVDYLIQDMNIFVSTYPAIVGEDAAGVVKKVGPNVTEFQVGDKVYVLSFLPYDMQSTDDSLKCL